MAEILLCYLAFCCFLIHVHNFPMQGCRTKEIDLVVVADFSLQRNLQIERIKVLVEFFLPLNQDDEMKLRFSLISLGSNDVVFGFDDHNTSIEIIEALENLGEYNDRSSLTEELSGLDNDTSSTGLRSLVKRQFLDGGRDSAQRLLVLIVYHSNDNLYLGFNPGDFLFEEYFKSFVIMGKDDSPPTQLSSDNLYSFYISLKDDLKLNQRLHKTLCGDCSRFWITAAEIGGALECYLISEEQNNVSWIQASSRCANLNSKLVSLKDNTYRAVLEELTSRAASNDVETYTLFLDLLEVKESSLESEYDESVVQGKWKDISEGTCPALQITIYGGYHNVTETLVETSCFKKITKTIACQADLREMKAVSTLELNKSPSKQSVDRTLRNPNFILKDNGIVSVSYEKHFYYRNKAVIRFDCNEGVALSYNFVCDGKRDCSEGEDEQYCSFDVYPQNTFRREPPGSSVVAGCEETRCSDGTCLPTQWFSGSKRDCVLYVTGNNSLQRASDQCAASCDKTICAYPSELRRGVQLCDQTVGMNGFQQATTNTCDNMLARFTWAPRCVYLRDRKGKATGCQGAHHLKNCKRFSCTEGFVKCIDSYCVPVRYILDGIQDCPFGEDERYLDIISTNYFICSGSVVRLHPKHVCDGIPHCPLEDDEFNCNVTCPLGFSCIDRAITVDSANQIEKLTSIAIFDSGCKYLDFSGLDLSSVAPDDRVVFHQLLEVRLSGCNIQSDVDFLFFNTLYKNRVYLLDLSFNEIRSLSRYGLVASMTYLKFLNISHNRHLTGVPSYFMSKLKDNLISLDISHTKISSLSSLDKFLKLNYINVSDTDLTSLPDGVPHSLKTFDMRRIPLTADALEPHFLNTLNVTVAIYTDHFRLCCPQFRGPGIAENVCHAPSNVISTCSDLIGTDFKRAVLWIFAIVAFVANLAVLIYRFSYDAKTLSMTYCLFVTCLGVADFLMGVYLLLIASADAYYRGGYIKSDLAWRTGPLCQFSGFLVTLSIEASMIFIFLITVDRLMVVKFPFGDYRFSSLTKTIVVCASWLLATVLAFVPLIFPQWEMYSSNAMCLGLPFRSSSVGKAYSAGVFILLNFFVFVFIACGQLIILHALVLNDSKMAQHGIQRRSRDITKQMCVIVFSNFACWFPVCVIGVRYLITDEKVSRDTYAWILVLVLPLNSAVDPLIYTVPYVYQKIRGKTAFPVIERQPSQSAASVDWGRQNAPTPN